MEKNYTLKKLNPESFGLKSDILLQIQNFLQENGCELESLIGWGSFGTVRLAGNVSTNNQVAIKRFYVEMVKHLESYIQQFSNLSQLKSPYTVNILGLLLDSTDKHNQYLYLVMEYLPNGNLKDYIKESNILSSV